MVVNDRLEVRGFEFKIGFWVLLCYVVILYIFNSWFWLREGYIEGE